MQLSEARRYACGGKAGWKSSNNAYAKAPTGAGDLAALLPPFFLFFLLDFSLMIAGHAQHRQQAGEKRRADSGSGRGHGVLMLIANTLSAGLLPRRERRRPAGALPPSSEHRKLPASLHRFSRSPAPRLSVHHRAAFITPPRETQPGALTTRKDGSGTGRPGCPAALAT